MSADSQPRSQQFVADVQRHHRGCKNDLGSSSVICHDWHCNLIDPLSVSRIRLYHWAIQISEFTADRHG